LTLNSNSIEEEEKLICGLGEGDKDDENEE